MPRIATAAELFAVTTPEEQREWLLRRRSTKQRLASFGASASDVGSPDDIALGASPAVAYVNQGRWVADCPTPGCGGAMALVRGAMGFLCGACLNVEVGYRYRPLSWPVEAVEAEAVLSVRMLPEQANWRPGESIAALEAENEAHGFARRTVEVATPKPGRAPSAPPPLAAPADAAKGN